MFYDSSTVSAGTVILDPSRTRVPPQPWTLVCTYVADTEKNFNPWAS
uniref:Uncharacterized protein n=1 Tax=Human herpesvirus 6B TaxID=32604 RepID=A0A2L2QD36_HHV6H|nr:hypothetical protein [Human betaherpesvirus 6B]AVI09058.1 hypothetical protein [Human betaherpesvirus 6B]